MRKYRRQNEQTKQKAQNRHRLALAAELPMEELMAGARADIETFAAELGLTIIQRVLEAEIARKWVLGAANRCIGTAIKPDM
jgi:hypothetical protein